MNQVEPYTYFSQVYNHLMSNVDYKFWANYIKEIHQTIGDREDIALELASGNCKLGKYLKKDFKQIYLSDISLQMLMLNNTKIPTVCCNMLHLPFKNKFDFIIVAFDSINYLNNEKTLNIFFKSIEKHLSLNGYLIFDVSLKGNSLKHLKELNRTGTYKGIKYKQVSEFDEYNNYHINTIDLSTKEGYKFKEIHTQKIYDFYYYFEVLENANLFVSECFNAFTFDDATSDSERIQFIVKRKN